MYKHSEEFYHAAIRNACPGACNIRYPVVRGGVSPLFLADSPTETFVFKFNAANAVFHNLAVSNLLNIYDIPVPRTTAHAYMDAWFEQYPYCPDLTLGQHIQNGASQRQVWSIYKQAIDIQNRISQIPATEFKPRYGRMATDMFILNQEMRVHPVLAHIYGAVYKRFAQAGKMHLLHTDIQPQNILVDSENRLSHLIDLDAVALCNESFSVLLMLRTYPIGNINEMLEYYQDTTRRKLNKKAIIDGLYILNKIRAPQLKLNQLMWRGYHPHKNTR